MYEIEENKTYIIYNWKGELYFTIFTIHRLHIFTETNILFDRCSFTENVTHFEVDMKMKIMCLKSWL